MKNTIKSSLVIAGLLLSVAAHAWTPSNAPSEKLEFYPTVEDAAKKNGYRLHYRDSKSVVWVDQTQYLPVIKSTSALVMTFNVDLDGEAINHITQQVFVTYHCENKTITTGNYVGWWLSNGALMRDKLQEYNSYGDLKFPKGSVTAYLKSQCPKR